MKEYWVNVYEKDMGRIWITRKQCEFAYTKTDVAMGKLLYRIHVKMKENNLPHYPHKYNLNTREFWQNN